MKKILSSFIVTLIVLLILWVATGWYFGVKAENKFKSLLKDNSRLSGQRLVRMELLNYQLTASGAKVSLELSSDYPALSERMKDLQLEVKLLNGPVFITQTGISVGSSLWVLTVVDVASDKTDKASKNVVKRYEDIFPKGLPSAMIKIDFNEKAHYDAKFGTSIADLVMTGVFDLNTQNNRGAILIKNFVLGNPPNFISSDKIKISYQHQKAITTRYKLGIASLQASSIKIFHKELPTFLDFGAKINSDISLENNNLKGYLKAVIKAVNSHGDIPAFPVEEANISLQFQGFSADALIAYSEANDDLNNLHQQAQWALEELGEVPEGQDQIWQLYNQIDESENKLPQAIAKKIRGSGSMNLHATTQYLGESSRLDGSLRLQREQLKISSWLSLFEGEAKVELDDRLFRSMQNILPITQHKFKLILRENKVLMAQ